jgi:hypothetical protein
MVMGPNVIYVYLSIHEKKGVPGHEYKRALLCLMYIVRYRSVVTCYIRLDTYEQIRLQPRYLHCKTAAFADEIHCS